MARTSLDQTVPGGRYVGPDGRAHNAHGQPVGTASADSAAPASGAGDGGEPVDYAAKTVDDLHALAESRGVAVTGTGANGHVVKADLVKALTKADKAR
jgi:hypothetical protein